MSVHSKLETVIKYAEGHYYKYRENAETLIQNPVGIGEHGDIIDEIIKHAKLAKEYKELRDFIITEFKQKGTLKG